MHTSVNIRLAHIIINYTMRCVEETKANQEGKEKHTRNGVDTGNWTHNSKDKPWYFNESKLDYIGIPISSIFSLVEEMKQNQISF
jgi:hypothetical protein